MSAPQSNIYICSGVRLDNRYEHSIYFENATAQREYFAGKVVKTFSAYSYLRKTWPLQVQATMEEARSWSYLYFRNGTGKTYYYFINQIEYKNDNMVELSLELDVLQTYLFDFEMLDCFVERQHTETDSYGEYTLDEGLETGELLDAQSYDYDRLNELCILVLSTFNPNYWDVEKPVQALAGRYDGVFSGLKAWAVNGSKWEDWGKQLEKLSEKGFIDGIVSMWMYPKELVALDGENTWEDDVLCKVVSYQTSRNMGIVPFGYRGSLDGYTPKNQKVLCYPYQFLYMHNNAGQAGAFRFERFTTPGEPMFIATGAVSPDGVVRMGPCGYNGYGRSALSYEHGLTLGNFPSCAWDADVYKLWLAQNQNQHQYAEATSKLAIAGGAVTAGLSLAMGNVAGAVGGVGAMIGGAQQIGAMMAQKADMSIQPPQARGAFSANVNISAGKQTFTFIRKTVTAENAKSVDNYFTMYGYKLNQVRKPNLCARPAFTYVKTVGCNITGNLCTEDRTKITGIFDHGITFWKNGNRIADYSQDNTV